MVSLATGALRVAPLLRRTLGADPQCSCAPPIEWRADHMVVGAHSRAARALVVRRACDIFWGVTWPIASAKRRAWSKRRVRLMRWPHVLRGRQPGAGTTTVFALRRTLLHLGRLRSGTHVPPSSRRCAAHRSAAAWREPRAPGWRPPTCETQPTMLMPIKMAHCRCAGRTALAVTASACHLLAAALVLATQGGASPRASSGSTPPVGTRPPGRCSAAAPRTPQTGNTSPPARCFHRRRRCCWARQST